MEKRIEILDKFLCEIVEHEELRNSLYFSAFIKLNDDKIWENQKQAFDKSISITSSLKTNFNKKMFEGPNGVKLEHFRTRSGDVRSRISKDMRDYAVHTEDLQKMTYPIYERIEILCLQLSTDFERVSTTISLICDEMEVMESIHKKFNSMVKEGKWNLMESLYGILKKNLRSWGSFFMTK